MGRREVRKGKERDARPGPDPTHPAGDGSVAVIAPFPPSPESATPGQAPETSSPRACFPAGGAGPAEAPRLRTAARPGRWPGCEERAVVLATPAERRGHARAEQGAGRRQ